MIYTLPELPYAYDALEPYIDTKTMELHHTKHHQTYVNNLNAALKQYPHYAEIPLEELLKQCEQLPGPLATAIRNNGGGHYNHTLFWTFMHKRAGGEPRGIVHHALEKTFGSFSAFQEQMNTAAKTCFGSGWAWLVFNRHGSLAIMTTANQDSPTMQQCVPILGIDVWEHAYYLTYQNRRVDYIDAWWHVIHWPTVEYWYKKYM